MSVTIWCFGQSKWLKKGMGGMVIMTMNKHSNKFLVCRTDFYQENEKQVFQESSGSQAPLVLIPTSDDLKTSNGKARDV